MPDPAHKMHPAHSSQEQGLNGAAGQSEERAEMGLSFAADVGLTVGS